MDLFISSKCILHTPAHLATCKNKQIRMDPVAAVNNAVEDGQGAAAPVPVENGGAAAPEPVAVAAAGEAEEAYEEEDEDDDDPMFNIYELLHEYKEVDGESRSCCIEYLTLETAKAIMAEFEKPGALHDDEGAHSNEDAVNAAFIRGVALGKYTLAEAQEIAQLISGIGRMGFARWCA